MTSRPLVTVLMSVYNDAAFVGEAVRSILAQTFTDFEFLVFDDGSTDDTPNVLAAFTDPRLRVVRSAQNHGISYQVNRGLREAAGRYIARMDGDDIADPARLAQQVAFMESHPDVAICGTQAVRFRGDGYEGAWRFPTEDRELLPRLLFQGAFCNPSTILRTSALRRHNLSYDVRFPLAEDYHLWYRLLRLEKGANLPSFLLRYRLSSSQITQERQQDKIACHKRVIELMLRDLGIRPTPRRVDLHWNAVRSPWPANHLFFARAIRWFNHLAAANAEHRIYDAAVLERELRDHAVLECRSATNRRFNGLVHLRHASFVRHIEPRLRLTFLAKHLLKPVRPVAA